MIATTTALLRLVGFLLFVSTAAGADRAAKWPSPGPELPAVTLLDHEGRDVRLDEVGRERIVIVNFFFPRCATICPMQTAVLRDVRAALAERAPDEVRRPLILSIAIDPEGSSPADLRRYAGEFDLSLGAREGWLMLSGSLETVKTLQAAFDESSASPLDHSGNLWIGAPARRRWTRILNSSPAASAPETIAALALEAAQ